MLHHAVHARDADRREQAANGGGDEANQQGDVDGDAGYRPRAGRGYGVDGVGHQRGHGEEEDERQASDQDVERDLVGRLLARCALDQRNHAVEKGFAGVGGDPDLDLIREDLGAAGYRAAIATRLADHRSALSGYHRFVHRGDAIDDFSIARDQFARAGDDHISGAQLGRGDFLEAAVREEAAGDGVRLGLPQRVRLRLAAGLGHGFGEGREQNGEPEPKGDLHFEAQAGGADEDVPNQENRRERRADLDHEDHGILHEGHGIQLEEGILEGAAQNLGIEQGARSNRLLRNQRR